MKAAARGVLNAMTCGYVLTAEQRADYDIVMKKLGWLRRPEVQEYIGGFASEYQCSVNYINKHPELLVDLKNYNARKVYSLTKTGAQICYDLGILFDELKAFDVKRLELLVCASASSYYGCSELGASFTRLSQLNLADLVRVMQSHNVVEMDRYNAKRKDGEPRAFDWLCDKLKIDRPIDPSRLVKGTRGRVGLADASGSVSAAAGASGLTQAPLSAAAMPADSEKPAAVDMGLADGCFPNPVKTEQQRATGRR